MNNMSESDLQILEQEVEKDAHQLEQSKRELQDAQRMEKKLENEARITEETFKKATEEYKKAQQAVANHTKEIETITQRRLQHVRRVDEARAQLKRLEASLKKAA